MARITRSQTLKEAASTPRSTVAKAGTQNSKAKPQHASSALAVGVPTEETITSPPVPSLHKLAPEIRNMIYPLVLEQEEEEVGPYDMFRGHNTPPEFLVAVRVDPLLYQEALAVFFKINYFDFAKGNGVYFKSYVSEATVARIRGVNLHLETFTNKALREPFVAYPKLLTMTNLKKLRVHIPASMLYTVKPFLKDCVGQFKGLEELSIVLGRNISGWDVDDYESFFGMVGWAENDYEVGFEISKVVQVGEEHAEGGELVKGGVGDPGVEESKYTKKSTVTKRGSKRGLKGKARGGKGKNK